MHCEIFKTLFRSHTSNYTMSGLRFFLKELSSTYYDGCAGPVHGGHHHGDPGPHKDDQAKQQRIRRLHGHPMRQRRRRHVIRLRSGRRRK